MESIATYFQGTIKTKDQQQHQPTTNQPILLPQPSSTKIGSGTTTTISTKIESFTSSDLPSSTPSSSQQQPLHQNSYQEKCNLLEYHIHEAVLVNKALRSELKQYKEKIDFEKRLGKFLVSRAKGIDS